MHRIAFCGRLDEVPVDVDVSLGESGELMEGAAREIEPVDAAAGAKVAHGDGDGPSGVCKAPLDTVQGANVVKEHTSSNKLPAACEKG